jgi:uncharacterized membrane protein
MRYNFKKRWIDFLNLLKQIGILLLAILVFIPLMAIGFLYTLFKHALVKFDYSLSKQFVPVVKAMYLSLDGLAGAFAGELLNDILKPKFVKYGKWNYTISATTGINYIKGDDKKFREILDCVLGKKHCEKATTKEQKCLYKID